jgi:hypothetical protein
MIISPFLVFIFICTACLYQPALHKEEPTEQIKKENRGGNNLFDNFQPGVIRFIVV